MKFTGERVIPDAMQERPEIYSEHLVRYAIAMNYCAMNDVLDVACGTGYGTNLLDSVANLALGGDNNVETLDYAREKYGLKFLRIDLEQQTIDSVFKKKFHIIVSFETIEHLVNPFFFMKSVKKSLNPNGLFIFSVPVKNSSIYHKQIYTYKQAFVVGDNFFKPIKTYIQRANLILHPAMAMGDYDNKGTYIIKVMS